MYSIIDSTGKVLRRSFHSWKEADNWRFSRNCLRAEIVNDAWCVSQWTFRR
jgi:hypothetical protein